MNDNQQNNAGENASNQPAIMIHTQYIKDLSLEIPHAPEIFRGLNEAPAVSVFIMSASNSEWMVISKRKNCLFWNWNIRQLLLCKFRKKIWSRFCWWKFRD